jgi:hypothetical protein
MAFPFLIITISLLLISDFLAYPFVPSERLYWIVNDLRNSHAKIFLFGFLMQSNRLPASPAGNVADLK